jgi:sec-independent protein translocase protein TatA
MFGLGVWELLIVLVIVLVLFGPKRLKNLGSELGSAIKGFRTAVKDDEDRLDRPAERPAADPTLIEGRVEPPLGAESRDKRQDSNV